MSNDRAPAHDERWGNHVPWSLRYEVVLERGDWTRFLFLVSNRLSSIFEHYEAGIPDHAHFMERLSAESLGRFVVHTPTTPAFRIKIFFSPNQIRREVQENGGNNLLRTILDRLEVLQSFLILLQIHQKHNALPSVIRDIKRFSADTGVLLNVKGDPPTLVPLEEPLLQKEVLDRLLPRLEAKFSERAADLIKAYHDLLKGADTNSIFGHAFKALEQVAREISGDTQLQLSDRVALGKAFPKLHGTIRETILKLAAQRGDEGGHGRLGPDEYEIRYLLFSICNVALLLLDYKEHCG
ncbi:MAG: hypothetical protein OJF51_001638 [Nitrospira sp.]|jgi:hypothetical protein|nr:MAG: hypothetical protein OJF51_001638 [Nitrospira sp.]